MTVPRKVVEYVPDRAAQRGWLSSWADMYSEVERVRQIAWAMYVRDFKALYRQSALGYFWAVFTPLLTVGLFVYLNGSGLLSVGSISVPYVVYVVAGMAFWQLFATGLTAATNSLVVSGSMLTKVNFPKESLVVAGYGAAAVPFAIQLLFASALMIGLSVPLSWGMLLALPAAVPLICIALGLGFALSLLNGVLRDVGTALPSLMSFLLFVTPVMYEMPQTGFAATLASMNPLYYLVAVPRDLLISGTTNALSGYLPSTVGAVLLLGLGWQLFHLAEGRLAERI